MPPHSQVEWQATLRTLCGSRTLVFLWSSWQDSRRANDVDLVHQDGISGRLDLFMGRVGEGIAEEKGGDLIVAERVVVHLFCS